MKRLFRGWRVLVFLLGLLLALAFGDAVPVLYLFDGWRGLAIFFIMLSVLTMLDSTDLERMKHEQE